MRRIFSYLDIALRKLYDKDKFILDNQSLNSISFRLGIYLNELLKSDLFTNHLEVDFNFEKSSNDYLDLVIHNRKNKDNLLTIKLEKNLNNLRSNLDKLKQITNLDRNHNYGVLVVLDSDYYYSYKLSSNYYEFDWFV